MPGHDNLSREHSILDVRFVHLPQDLVLVGKQTRKLSKVYGLISQTLGAAKPGTGDAQLWFLFLRNLEPKENGST